MPELKCPWARVPVEKVAGDVDLLSHPLRGNPSLRSYAVSTVHTYRTSTSSSTREWAVLVDREPPTGHPIGNRTRAMGG